MDDFETPSEKWQRIRRGGIERRRLEVEERLAGEPFELPWLVAEAGLTEKQHEVCVLRFGYELSLGEIAQHLGIRKNAVVERLAWAQKKVEAYWGSWPVEAELDEKLARLDQDDD